MTEPVVVSRIDFNIRLVDQATYNQVTGALAALQAGDKIAHVRVEDTAWSADPATLTVSGVVFFTTSAKRNQIAQFIEQRQDKITRMSPTIPSTIRSHECSHDGEGGRCGDDLFLLVVTEQRSA